jgi:hypothetical protein
MVSVSGLILKLRSLFGAACSAHKHPRIVPPGFRTPIGFIADAGDMLNIVEIFHFGTTGAIQPDIPVGTGLQKFTRI